MASDFNRRETTAELSAKALNRARLGTGAGLPRRVRSGWKLWAGGVLCARLATKSAVRWRGSCET